MRAAAVAIAAFAVLAGLRGAAAAEPPAQPSASTAPAPAALAPAAASTGQVPAPAATPSAAPAPPAAPPDHASPWLDRLGDPDVREVERAVATIVALPAADATADLLFAAAHACETKLLDAARALAIDERILAEYPDARVARAAGHRATALRALVGPHGETAQQARALAQLIADADAAPPDAVIRRGDQLASAPWPGAPTAALWLADWLRGAGRLDEAQARYAVVTTRWPTLPEAAAALRGGAGCAIDAHDWSLAEQLAHRLPLLDDTDRSARDELLAGAARGRRLDRWHTRASLAIAIAFAALLASLLEALLRSPPATRRRALRPPIEIIFLGPVAAVLIGVAFTAHRLIAPAVAVIATGGIALAWLSGTTLEQLRLRGRAHRLRSVAHIVACFAGIAGLAYVALAHGGLLDMLIETVRFGPES